MLATPISTLLGDKDVDCLSTTLAYLILEQLGFEDTSEAVISEPEVVGHILKVGRSRALHLQGYTPLA